MKQTQRQLIIRYCEVFGSITVREAFELGVNSPTKRISEISRDPRYVVEKVDEDSINRWGEQVHFRRYFIRKKEAEDVS